MADFKVIGDSPHRPDPHGAPRHGEKHDVTRPTFLVIGAARCGTTSMCDLLGRHPDVFMSNPKETNFFCHDDVFAKGWEWYESHFASAADKTARGEGSARYGMPTDFVNTVPRIAQHLPDCRLIYMVRHPLKRIESDWKLAVTLGSPWGKQSFCESVQKYPGLIRMSSYWTQINKYRRYLADEQILVIFFADFLANPDDELRRAFRHIGVDAQVTIEDARKPRNASERLHWRKDSSLLRLARRLPGFAQARNLIPRWVRRQLKAVFTEPGDVKKDLRAVWDKPTKEFAIGQLAQESARFLEAYG